MAIDVACDCGRTDGWHLAKCRSLTAPAVEVWIDGSHWIYRNPRDGLAQLDSNQQPAD